MIFLGNRSSHVQAPAGFGAVFILTIGRDYDKFSAYGDSGRGKKVTASELLKDNDAYLRKLKGIAFLGHIEEKDFRRILKFSDVRQYKAGETILAEGSYDNWIYFLISGKVRISKAGEEISFLQRTGDLFGEMGVIDGSARSASVRAVEDTICLATDISFMDRLDRGDRTVFSAMLFQILAEILAHRLRITSEELVKAKEEIVRLRKGAGVRATT